MHQPQAPSQYPQHLYAPNPYLGQPNAAPDPQYQGEGRAPGQSQSRTDVRNQQQQTKKTLRVLDDPHHCDWAEKRIRYVTLRKHRHSRQSWDVACFQTFFIAVCVEKSQRPPSIRSETKEFRRTRCRSLSICVVGLLFILVIQGTIQAMLVDKVYNARFLDSVHDRT